MRLLSFILPTLLLLFLYQPTQAGNYKTPPQQKHAQACEAPLSGDSSASHKHVDYNNLRLKEASELTAGPSTQRLLIAALTTNSALTQDFLIQKPLGSRVLIDKNLTQEISETPREDRLAIVSAIDRWLQHPSQLQRTDKAMYFQLYTRRNLELVRLLLVRPEFLELIRTLKSQEATSSKLGTIDEFLKRYSSLNLPGKGGYSFSLVLEAAELIQRTMRPVIDMNEYLEIYGSFPNLKANLSTSDVDIHLSEGMEAKYFKSFKVKASLTGAFQQDRGIKISLLSRGLRKATRDSFGAALLKAEDEVGTLLKRNVRRYGELLGILVPAPFPEEFYSFYNPVVVRIQKDKSVIVIRDIIGNQTIEIPVDAQGGTQ